jgi:hypothetical protein
MKNGARGLVWLQMKTLYHNQTVKNTSYDCERGGKKHREDGGRHCERQRKRQVRMVRKQQDVA